MLTRPTTKDLAEAAGVSLATVDRVLNDRPNVSARARQRVNNAIDALGFVRNLAAVNLARNKIYRFRFILPEKGDEYVNEIARNVEVTNRSLKSDLALAEAVRVPMHDPHGVANYLGALSGDEVDGVAVMAPESPQVRDAMARLHERGIHCVQFLAGQDRLQDLDFIGIDNSAAGATAARLIGRFLNGSSGKVMVIAETMQSHDSLERRLGFDALLSERFKNLTALPSLETYGDEARAGRIISRQFTHHKDIVAVYVLSSEPRISVEQVGKITDLQELTLVAHERTPFSEKALKEEMIDAIIAQNPGHAVRSTLRILRARSEYRTPVSDQENIRIEILLPENL
ncbi:MAG: LacI family DNA-binding transcriptional regulator [Pseudomonadota bacterium]